jgi:hypothetical protein
LHARESFAEHAIDSLPLRFIANPPALTNRREYLHKEEDMQHTDRSLDHELNWMRHAYGYLAAVHQEVHRNPADAQMRELLQAMTAAIASRRTSVVPTRV